MAYRAVKMEREFPDLKSALRLKMYPEGEHNVRVTEARRRRITRAEGASQWKRAQELETVWPQDKMGLDDETIEALDNLRERMGKDN